MENPQTQRILSLFVGLLASLSAAACDEAALEPNDVHIFRDDDDRPETETPGDPDGGAWINNGLENPNVSGVDPLYALSSIQGLDPASPLLGDPDRREAIQYLVECALPPEDSITKVVGGQTLVFDGQLGLAPEWATGACDQDCQQWVSACMLARTNISGETVWLWMRGAHPALGTGTSPSYPVYEASFFGNIFEDEQERYICQGSAVSSVVAYLDGRTCSSLGNSCAFTKYTDCELASRCDFDDLVSPWAADCTPDGGQPHHTITTYIPVL